MNSWVRGLRRHRRAVATSFDAGVWLASFAFFAFLRFPDSASVPWGAVLLFAAAALVLHVVLGWSVGLHQGRARTGTLEEMVALGGVTMGVAGVLFFVNLGPIWVPRSAPVAAGFMALVVMAWARALWRGRHERHLVCVPRETTKAALVVGAGESGIALVASMLRDPAAEWRPVGLLDDDPALRHRRIKGVPVVGALEHMTAAVDDLGASTVVIAIPNADRATVGRIAGLARGCGADVKVLPTSTEQLADPVGIRDIRDINLNDVLGRHQLDTDVAAIAGCLTGRRVLVTGAGGSIGSELCRQIDRYQPAELIMLDRDESGLHAVQLSLSGRALLDSDDVVLADIRDREALVRIFRQRQPDVVFHAAALKHLPMLEQYPCEAVKTNVLGTVNVLDAAAACGVSSFINISTDKAANPSSVLGFSKRVTERLTAGHASTGPGSYLSVRFGNVIGSRGIGARHVRPADRQRGTGTVTDPDVTRFFMSIEEACQLVIQAAAIGSPGEVLVLDMGEPVSIVGWRAG